MTSRTHLSPDLKTLVGTVEAALGRVIAQAEGRALFEAVERVRQQMVCVRTGAEDERAAALAEARATLRGLEPEARAALGRAYTVYLELVNLCENAFRTHRLRARARGREPHVGAARATAVWVLTAHPTESRSTVNIHLTRRVQRLLIEALERSEAPDAGRLEHLLHLVWRTGTHPHHKPTITDEAEHLFSLVSDDILGELIRLQREGHVVFFRTWVGGDKDGHPGVGPEETDVSLNLSRSRLLDFVEARLVRALERDVHLLPDEPLRRAWLELRELLGDLRHLGIGDGRRLTRFREALAELTARYAAERGAPHPELLDLERLLKMFPGLVIPLELREERGLFQADSVIAQMLHYLKDVARGGQIEWYVRGLVVSMTDCAQDLLEAHARVAAVLGESRVPIVPLFEMPDVLPRAPEILEETFADPGFAAMRTEDWGLEVMLGYSDTSKRMGVLASRLAIHEAMRAINAWAEGRGLRVVFFHGSGGSVGRGGGTIEEQFATWPRSSLALVKQTLQGEMIERTLATPEILRSQVEKIAQHQHDPPPPREACALTTELATRAEARFVDVASQGAFHRLLRKATPYARLGTLNIGSRPVSRAGSTAGGLESLRAIPWVLCWTQTRYLLHAWLGTGAAWRQLKERAGGREELLAAIQVDPLLRSYLRVLGFTLAKTAPAIWRAYAETLAGDEDRALLDELEAERLEALDLAVQATDDGELLSYRPWLRESIFYRAPMIHPLNLLQIDALARDDLSETEELLFRETVTGIAAGMVTTG